MNGDARAHPDATGDGAVGRLDELAHRAGTRPTCSA